jgi:plastocyanin
MRLGARGSGFGARGHRGARGSGFGTRGGGDRVPSPEPRTPILFSFAAALICFSVPPSALAQTTVDTTITIRASGSTLEFQPPRVSVKHGTHARIRFVNEGTLPHNVVLPRDPGDIDQLAVEAYTAAETGYVPLTKPDKLLAYSALASPGDTVDVTLVVPPPGEYTYICLFPGHANSMFGTLRSLR